MAPSGRRCWINAIEGAVVVLPPYTVRESSKARRVRLQITPQARVEVIVPSGFDRDSIPQLLQTKTHWLQQTLEQVRTQLHERGTCTYPPQIHLRALDRHWGIHYRPTHIPTIHLVQRSDHLELVGNVDEWSLCRHPLRQWLRQQAQIYLSAHLHQLSAQLDLPFQRVTIRSQKTRWGSCSRRHTISLNDKLLFLPPELMRYVLIHELCHTRHLNHSPPFWRLVAQHEPRSQQLDAQLRQARVYLPTWIED